MATWENIWIRQVVAAIDKKPKWMWGGYLTDQPSPKLFWEPPWRWEVQCRQRSLQDRSQKLWSLLKPPWQAATPAHRPPYVSESHYAVAKSQTALRSVACMQYIYDISKVKSVSAKRLMFLSTSPFVGSSGMDQFSASNPGPRQLLEVCGKIYSNQIS